GSTAQPPRLASSFIPHEIFHNVPDHQELRRARHLLLPTSSSWRPLSLPLVSPAAATAIAAHRWPPAALPSLAVTAAARPDHNFSLFAHAHGSRLHGVVLRQRQVDDPSLVRRHRLQRHWPP